MNLKPDFWIYIGLTHFMLLVSFYTPLKISRSDKKLIALNGFIKEEWTKACYLLPYFRN